MAQKSIICIKFPGVVIVIDFLHAVEETQNPFPISQGQLDISGLIIGISPHTVHRVHQVLVLRFDHLAHPEALRLELLLQKLLDFFVKIHISLKTFY